MWTFQLDLNDLRHEKAGKFVTRCSRKRGVPLNEMHLEREPDRLPSEIFHGKSGPYCRKTVTTETGLQENAMWQGC